MMRIRLIAALFALLFTQSALATSYFVAPSTHSPAGSDANNGTSAATPWLSANHAVNCGDTITALTDSGYTVLQFNSFVTGGHPLGTVTCTGVPSVAWIQCQTFAGCVLNNTSDTTPAAQPAIVIDQPYWGIQGFVITRTGGTDGSCILITGNAALTHHVVVANNVINGCEGGGIYAITLNGRGTDYIAIIGNAVYNAAQGTSNCDSGISTIGQQLFDSVPGTHTYIAGNFAWGNIEGLNCAGSSNTDGEGFQIDVSDGTYFSKANPYLGQTVIENNWSAYNGGPGFLYTKHKEGAQIIINNTSYGNFTDSNRATFSGVQGEIESVYSSNVQMFNNISQATVATAGTPAENLYAVSISVGDASMIVDGNWFANTAIAGQNTTTVAPSGQFAYGGRNILGLSPAFASPANPGAPSCSGKTNVANCMATTIANFTPTTSGALGMGYQAPQNIVPGVGASQDALFPAWLCNVTIPAGLITKHC
jgi:hypothetical protein